MRPRRRSPVGAVAGVAAALATALLPAGAGADGPRQASAPAAAPAAGWDVAPVPLVEQERIRAELRRVLASDELRDAGRPRGAGTMAAGLWLRLQAWLAHQPAGVTRGVVAACLVVLLAVGAHLAFSVRAVLRGARGPGPLAPAAEHRRSPAELRAAAAAAAGSGDHGEAVRLLYLAALRAVDLGGVCDVAAGTADWTVVERCRAAPGVEGPLGELVLAFQRSRFGGRPCDRSHYDRCRGLVDAIEAAGGPRAEGAAAPEAAA